jgi:hypothetical protein
VVGPDAVVVLVVEVPPAPGAGAESAEVVVVVGSVPAVVGTSARLVVGAPVVDVAASTVVVVELGEGADRAATGAGGPLARAQITRRTRPAAISVRVRRMPLPPSVPRRCPAYHAATSRYIFGQGGDPCHMPVIS